MNTYDEEVLEKAIQLLKKKRLTVAQLSKRFKRSERTIKRWFLEIQERGHHVIRDGVGRDAPYMILSK